MTAVRGSLLAPLATLTLLAAPGAAAAQTCGIAPGVAAAGGYASHRVAGGTDGVALGADIGFRAGPAVVRLGYRRTVLAGEAADPDGVRGVASYPAVRMEGVTVCGDAHAGVTHFAVRGDAGTVLAGGVGVTLAPAGSGPLHPYVSLRGLAARTVGTVLDVDIDAAGLALGVEAGLAATIGPLSLRVAGARDGFDDGLGVTPYPTTSLELAVGYRF